MSKPITIKTKEHEFIVKLGKPVMIRWKNKNKGRSGMSCAIGWLKPGEKPATIELVHQTFSTWDEVEQEYVNKWTIYMSQILEIKQLKSF